MANRESAREEMGRLLQAKRAIEIRERSRRLVMDPDRWPNWPYLPMKNYVVKGSQGLSVLGILVPGKSVVYEANLFSLPSGEEGWAALPKHEYPTIQALLDDGWIVD